jgi:quercetin dioxygenase-like cupin family protein
VSARHAVLTADQARPVVPEGFEDRSQDFRRWSAINDRTGSVHQEFGICELDPEGSVGWHVHSFEESFYVLEGEAILEIEGQAHLLREGDYGVISVGTTHAWRGLSSRPARWAEMLAPQPRRIDSTDTFWVPARESRKEPRPVDPRDPRTRFLGHIDPSNMDVDRQTQDMLAVSASMRTALLAYSGITVKMMVDSDLGAHLSTMFMVQYEPGGLAGAHDHPLEETYMILEGEVDAVFDGHSYRLTPGDIAFAAVGCIHEFTNPADAPVRWLETQAPQPPARHSYRFARDWTYLDEALS